MKSLFFALATVFFGTAAAAQGLALEPWQEVVATKVLEYSKVEKAQWTAPDFLTLQSKHGELAWSTVADQHLCKNLLSRAHVDRPEGTEFVITVWHATTNKMLGVARCR